MVTVGDDGREREREPLRGGVLSSRTAARAVGLSRASQRRPALSQDTSLQQGRDHPRPRRKQSPTHPRLRPTSVVGTLLASIMADGELPHPHHAAPYQVSLHLWALPSPGPGLRSRSHPSEAGVRLARSTEACRAPFAPSTAAEWDTRRVEQRSDSRSRRAHRHPSGRL